MPIDRVFLIGSGGHAGVVTDCLLMSMDADGIRIFDHDVSRNGSRVCGIGVIAPFDLSAIQGPFHIAIGSNVTRSKLTTSLAQRDVTPQTVIHPHASVSAFARIGVGCFIAALAAVAANAEIGPGSIINHGAAIDHDSIVGDFTHIAPNATLGGGVQIGDLAMVGSGAVILPGVKIGKLSVVGAGAVVTQNVPDGEIWAGVPATFKRKDSD